MPHIRKAKVLFINEKPIKIMKYPALGMNNAFHKNHCYILWLFIVSDIHTHNPYHLLQKTMRMKIKLIVKYQNQRRLN